MRSVCLTVLAAAAMACGTSAGTVHGPVIGADAEDAGSAASPSDAAPNAEAGQAQESSTDAAPTTTLFDGTLGPDWKMSTITNQPGRDDPGHFQVEDGALVAYPGTDLGLLWYSRPMPSSFVLELEWRLDAADDNSGIFVRFPDPSSKGFDNTAYVAIEYGFEIQIDERGRPDGAPDHTTGAVYNEPNQTYSRVVANPPGAWNTFEITVVDQTYRVRLNGNDVSRFVNGHAGRGDASPAYVGLQTHTGHVAFRNIRARAL